MEDIVYIIGQAVGIVAIILGFLSYQMRSQKKLILAQTLTCLAFTVHYLLIGAYSGMALNAVCVFGNYAYYLANKRGGVGYLLPSVYAAALLVISIFAWEAWYSVLIVGGIVIHTFCMAFKRAQWVRISILVTSPMVLVYDCFVLSVGGLIYESVAIISSVIGIIRYRKGEEETVDV